MYNYCTIKPYSFMTIDTRPTASITFKKNFNKPIDYLQIMTRKKQNKILDAKIESNVNQYKVDRMNAEISAFLSGDLNKYEFLKRIDLNYKTAQGYQEEGVVRLLKDIRDSLRGGARPPGPDNNNDDNNDDNDDDDDDDNNGDDDDGDNNDDDRPDYNNMPDLETEEEASERISTNALDKFKNNIEIEMNNLDKIVKNKENEFSSK